MKFLIYTAAFIAALATVLSTRLLIPAALLVFKAVEQSFAPEADATSAPVLAAVAVPEPVATPTAPVSTAKPKRTTRKRAAVKKPAVAEAVA